MKKTLLGLILSGIGIMPFASAQTVVYHENFETPSNGDSVTTSGTHLWSLVDSIANSGTQSFTTGAFNIDDTSYLVTDAFSTAGMSFVELRFSHVCKIEFFDLAMIEVSPDSGQTWTKIGGSDYFGASLNYTINQDSSFNVTSYSSVWQPGDAFATPQDSWFQNEIFDVSKYLENKQNAMVRFTLIDKQFNGSANNYGWLVDDIEIEVAPCELIPPAMTVNNKPGNLVYFPGPFNFNVTATDDSGIDTVFVAYSINGGPFDTLGLVETNPDTYNGNLPPINQGDTVCYQIVARDGSNCQNLSLDPLTGYACFRFPDNIPLPYFTNFDNGSDWVSEFTQNGSQWQLGTPTYGTTNAPFSAPDAWDVNTGTAYGPNANTTLTTRAFNFSGVIEPTLEFQLNYNTQANSDGMWVEYSTDSVNWTVLGSVGAPNSTNWYNTPSLNGRPAWTGNSGGFVKASIKFDDCDNEPSVFFRFRFTSNGFLQNDGVTVDDFAIIPPPPFDGALTDLYNPGALALGNVTDSVRLRVKNTGLEILDTINISYSLNGAPPVSITVYDTLFPGDAKVYNVGPYAAVMGANSFCAYIDVPRDTNAVNDTICLTVSGVNGSTIPYFDNFDTGSTFMPATMGGSPWELGTPTVPAGFVPYSGPNSWDIDLDAAYLSNTNSVLTTQVFGFGNVFSPEISFWYNSQTQNNTDGMYIEYTTNGTNWILLGEKNDPLGENWMPNNVNAAGSKPGWSGNSQGWQYTKLKMPEFSNISGIQFRFVFRSDFFNQSNGFSIDDINIGPPADFDVELVSIENPIANDPCALSDFETIQVLVANVGAEAIDTIPLAYQLNSNPIVYDTLYGKVFPGDTILFSFSQAADYSQGQTNYNLDVWAFHALDTLALNDSILDFFIRNDKISMPYTEDFENFGLGSPGILKNGWTQATNDTWDWTVHSGGTTSGSTGPSGDHTTGSGIYLYTETSGSGSNKVASFVSSCVDFANASVPKIEFWYHMYGSAMGTLNLDVQDNTGTWNTEWNLSGDQGNLWQKATVDLSNYAGQVVKIRFRAQTGTSFTSDMAIDDIYIYEPQPFDAGVVEITAPREEACDLSASETVSVMLSNFGLNPMNQIPVGYRFNGGPVTIDTLFATVNPGDTVPFTFSIPVDLSAPGTTFNFEAFTMHPGDTVIYANDTTAITLVNQGLPYNETFSAFPLGEKDLLNGWFQDDADFGNWRVHTGSTPSFGTGPTSGNGGAGKYFYIEANDYFNGTSNLLSPCLDLSTLVCPKVTFFYHMSGNGMGTLSFDVLDQSGAWTTLWTQAGDQGTSWQKVELVLGDFASQIVKVRFSGTTIGSTISDMAIDDFNIEDTPPYDAEDFAINNPIGQSAGGDDIYPEVVLRNAGCDTITSLDVAYSINGGAPVIEPFTGIISSGNTFLFTFTTPYTSPVGDYTICTWVVSPADTNALNDTICEVISGIPVHPVEYCTDFDQANDGWKARDGNDTWERGTPGGGTINTAITPPNVWMTNRTSNYLNNSNDNLYTPYFDLTGALDPEFHADIWVDCESGWDGMRVDYSIDDGQTWLVLGSVGSIGSVNWYTNTALNSSGLPGWDGSTGGWMHVSHPLGPIALQSDRIQFRFNFSSDGSVNNGDGVAVENFCVIVPIQNSAGSETVSAITGGLVFPGPNVMEAEIINSGVAPLSKFVVKLDIDNGNFVVVDTVIVPQPLAFQSVYKHTFSVPWNATEGKHDICMYTSRPNDTLDGFTEDDTLCTTTVVFDSVNTLPYCNDFEDTTLPGWATLNPYNYSLPGTNWEMGDPRKPTLNYPYSGSNCWATGIRGTYSKKDSSALYSPLFVVDSSSCYEISFWHWFQTEKQHDGGTVMYSQDQGLSWNSIGYAFEPGWFNTPWLTGLPQVPPIGGWSGNSGGYVYSSHLIKFPDSMPVIFMFRFASDVTIEDEGWLIDDFCFQEYTDPCVISVEEDLPEFMVSQPMPNPSDAQTRFELNLPFAGDVYVEVTNILGETMIQKSERGYSGVNNIGLNTSNLEQGIYQVRFVFEDQTVVRNLSIAR